MIPNLEKIEYQSIPVELKEKLIEFALEVHKKNIGLTVLANIVTNDESNIDTSKQDNNVFVYVVHPFLTRQVQNIYTDFPQNLANREPLNLSNEPGKGVLIQVINGPLPGEECNTIHPHVDPDCRPDSLMYILSTGGDNVKTTWYNVKNKDIAYTEIATHVYDLPIYSKDNLEIVEEHVMQEDGWYLFNHSVPHSVDNIKSPRIILTLPIDFTELRKVFVSTLDESYYSKLLSGWETLDCLK